MTSGHTEIEIAQASEIQESVLKCQNITFSNENEASEAGFDPFRQCSLSLGCDCDCRIVTDVICNQNDGQVCPCLNKRPILDE